MRCRNIAAKIKNLQSSDFYPLKYIVNMTYIACNWNKEKTHKFTFSHMNSAGKILGRGNK